MVARPIRRSRGRFGGPATVLVVRQRLRKVRQSLRVCRGQFPVFGGRANPIAWPTFFSARYADFSRRSPDRPVTTAIGKTTPGCFPRSSMTFHITDFFGPIPLRSAASRSQRSGHCSRRAADRIDFAGRRSDCAAVRVVFFRRYTRLRRLTAMNFPAVKLTVHVSARTCPRGELTLPLTKLSVSGPQYFFTRPRAMDRSRPRSVRSRNGRAANHHASSGHKTKRPLIAAAGPLVPSFFHVIPLFRKATQRFSVRSSRFCIFSRSDDETSGPQPGAGAGPVRLRRRCTSSSRSCKTPSRTSPARAGRSSTTSGRRTARDSRGQPSAG